MSPTVSNDAVGKTIFEARQPQDTVCDRQRFAQCLDRNKLAKLKCDCRVSP